MENVPFKERSFPTVLTIASVSSFERSPWCNFTVSEPNLVSDGLLPTAPLGDDSGIGSSNTGSATSKGSVGDKMHDDEKIIESLKPFYLI